MVTFNQLLFIVILMFSQFQLYLYIHCRELHVYRPNTLSPASQNWHFFPPSNDFHKCKVFVSLRFKSQVLICVTSIDYNQSSQHYSRQKKISFRLVQNGVVQNLLHLNNLKHSFCFIHIKPKGEKCAPGLSYRESICKKKKNQKTRTLFLWVRALHGLTVRNLTESQFTLKCHVKNELFSNPFQVIAIGHH